MKTKINNELDEDLIILCETLAAFQKMKTKGFDKISSQHQRECKKRFIEQTKKDIEWVINYKKKLNQ
jgi:hypothetical protein